MNDLDIVLVNIISYMGGILTGLGFCFKYKKHFLLKTSSHHQLSDLANCIQTEIGNQHISNTNVGPPIMASNHPVMASAPPAQSVLKEVVIRTTE